MRTKNLLGFLLMGAFVLSALTVFSGVTAHNGNTYDQSFQLNDAGFDLYKGKPGGSGGGSGPQETDWGYSRVNADAGRAGASGTTIVAVLDSGIDSGNSDLAGIVVACFSGIKRADYGCGDRNVKDDGGHGTHVAGTIGAVDNSEGTVGIAAGHVQIINGKVLGKRGGDWNDLAWAITHATDLGADVITMSLGGDISGSSLIGMLQNAIDYATGNGVAVLSAAGNEGTCGTGDIQHSWPAENDGVFTVGASGIVDASGNFVTEIADMDRDAMPCFSNEMPDGVVDITGPGVYITATKSGGGVTDMSGTSMATPHVAAAIALLMASGMSATQAQNTLMNSASLITGSSGSALPIAMQGAGLFTF